MRIKSDGKYTINYTVDKKYKIHCANPFFNYWGVYDKSKVPKHIVKLLNLQVTEIGWGI